VVVSRGESVVTIRGEALTDHAAIHAVHTGSFPTAHEADLVDALRCAGRLTISLVAVEHDAVVGHVAFSPVSMPGAMDGIGLAPVAVLPAFRRRGVAAQLIRGGLAECARRDHGFVVVLGDPHYYGRFGFTSARAFRLRDEYGGGDAFQALELRPGAIPAAGGLVRYAPELAAHA
jgi:putative acetyltransferase